MSRIDAAGFQELASDLAAYCATQIELGTSVEVPGDALGQAFSSLVALYAARAQAGELLPMSGHNSALAVTDVAVVCTAMMEAADLSLFDLGAWQSLSGVGRRIGARPSRPTIHRPE